MCPPLFASLQDASGLVSAPVSTTVSVTLNASFLSEQTLLAQLVSDATLSAAQSASVGNAASALSTAAAVGSVLNTASGLDDAARNLAARVAQRDGLIAVVSGAVSVAASQQADTWQQVGDVVSVIAAQPSEVSLTAQAGAVSALLPAPLYTAAVSADTGAVRSLVSALSLLAQASVASGGGNSIPIASILNGSVTVAPTESPPPPNYALSAPSSPMLSSPPIRPPEPSPPPVLSLGLPPPPPPLPPLVDPVPIPFMPGGGFVGRRLASGPANATTSTGPTTGASAPSPQRQPLPSPPPSADAAAAAAAALAAAIAAFRVPRPMPPPNVMSSLMSVLDGISANLLGQLSVPGEAPAVVSSPAINAVLQLDSLAPSSRVFTAGITAPGALSAFKPLPADTFAGIVPPGQSVRTVFYDLAFTFHRCAPLHQ